MGRLKKIGPDHKVIPVNDNHNIIVFPEIGEKFESEYNKLITLGKLTNIISRYIFSEYRNLLIHTYEFKNDNYRFFLSFYTYKSGLINKIEFNTPYKSLWNKCMNLIEERDDISFDNSVKAATYILEATSGENFFSLLKLASLVI